MRSWPEVYLPPVDGGISHRPLQLFDSYKKRLVEVDADNLSMYVCGITPYDATHLGHAATYITFDLIHRYLIASGSSVHFAENVTDIDDPLLERARRDNQDWQVLAHDQIDLFTTDMTQLRVIPPEHFLGVVEKMKVVIEAVSQIKERGLAYFVDRDLYLDLAAVPGAITSLPLPSQTALEIFAQRGGDPERQGKRNPLDPLLWRGFREGEPSWDSPFGFGRPGWHIECTALALGYLPDCGASSISIQGGGSDLYFPHHFMTGVQAEAITQKTFAQIYVHAGMIALDGEKMSKSRGNLLFVSRLLKDGVDPAVLRLSLMWRHYGEDFEWTELHLNKTAALVERLRTNLSKEEVAPTSEVVQDMVDSISRDLDVPSVVEILERWCSGCESGASGGSAGEISRALDTYLGIAL